MGYIMKTGRDALFIQKDVKPANAGQYIQAMYKSVFQFDDSGVVAWTTGGVASSFY